jgi:serine/threonine-protein kinase
MRTCPQCTHDNADAADVCLHCGAMLGSEGGPCDPLIGRVVSDRFRIVRPIGEGGMGRVYLAEQQLGTATRAVAIKVLKTRMSDAAGVARFYRECETVAQLSHPNTIRIYDFGQIEIPFERGGIDTRLYIAMEYVEGRSLSEALAEGPLPLDTVDRFVRQIGNALTEVHRRGIVHRDLKPDNVLLARDEAEGEIVKVCDFGIAKRGTGGPEITVQGTIVGTPAYMSPEQISNGPVDERSDVYALALITYEMLTGARPFVARTPVEWAAAHISEQPRSFDEFPSTRMLPPERRNAILRALEKDPARRTPTARAFVEEFCRRDSSIGRPRVPDPPPVPIALGNARLAGALAALALLGGGVAVAIGLSARGAPDPVPVASDAPPEVDAGLDAGDPTIPPEWLTILHYEDRTEDSTAALGPPDGRCARIGPRGTIVLELTPGIRISTDGTEAPDLRVEIDAWRSGPYRVDVGVERRRFTTIAQGLIESALLDVDQFGITRFRYVRIKNREARGIVCVDAVAAFRQEDVRSFE